MKKTSIIFSIVFCLAALSACQKKVTDAPTVSVSSLRDVSAIKLNFRFENDVPAPPPPTDPGQTEEKNAVIQTDFDQNRPQETLDRTIGSPDKKRFLAVYQQLGDTSATYRLDMYSADGKLLRKITPNGLAVHYPDTIVWSPDSTGIAFMGMLRLGPAITVPTPLPDAPTPPSLDDSDTNTTADPGSNEASDANANTTPSIEPANQVLTFRTQQIYSCNADGGDLRPLTQNEGFIYFYFVWAPDGSALVSLVATWKEWQYMQYQADQRGEFFVPWGRPRLVEKNGRIRLLDDNLTSVRPVWSPDSAKVALAFDKDVRIYDVIGDAPTQAGIPLRNQLLIASQKYDEDLRRKEESNSNSESNLEGGVKSDQTSSTNSAEGQGVNTLPDENTIISFNPIIQLEWSDDKMLYLQTGYVKEFKDSTQNTRSYLRWHRLLLSPQAVKLN